MVKQQRMRDALTMMAAIGLAGSSATALAGGQHASLPQPATTSEAPAVPLGTIEVIGVAPGPGAGVPERKVPGNVQEASGREIQNSQAFGLASYMSRHLGSVFINSAQGNPLQPNLSYRGYTISPLLGLPQGLAVYQDGVRINEPFGATVNFSLIPLSAISSIELIPGANPVYGRNALGGALSIETKSGFSDPGVSGEAEGGSFDRRYLQAQVGGHGDDFGYFVTGEYFDEDGWRDFSPSTAKRAFAKLSWRGTESQLDLSITAADTDLIDNGSLPVQLLAIDRSVIFTRPDETQSALTMFNLTGRHRLDDDLLLSGNVYFRRNDIDTLNGDDSDFAPCEAPAHQGLLCAGIEQGDEAVIHNARGEPVEAKPAVLGGTRNTSTTNQDGYGGNVQMTFLDDLFGRPNQFVLGAAVNGADIEFHSQTELAHLDPTRLAIGIGILQRRSFVAADIHNLAWGLYFSDTWSASSALALTLSGRYNHTSIEIDDRIGTALNGDHDYSHFNPAIGATYWFTPTVGGYARYSVSNRTPAAVELTCADPEDPCRLPNGFVSDPHLDQVIAHSQEIGVRGRWAHVNATLALFRTINEHDIQFISAGKLRNTGFFKNVGETLRQGVELTVKGQLDWLHWFLDYTHLDAEFRDPFVARSANNPLADAQGEIHVEPGDRLPGTPDQLFKAGATIEVTSAFKLGATLVHYSERFLRGDESNQLEPIDGYTLVDLNGTYQFNRYVSVFAEVANLFDTEYASFGTLGEADEVLGNRFDSPRFLTPGAPRAIFVGVRVSL